VCEGLCRKDPRMWEAHILRLALDKRKSITFEGKFKIKARPPQSLTPLTGEWRYIVVAKEVSDVVYSPTCVTVCCEKLAEQVETWRNRHLDKTTDYKIYGMKGLPRNVEHAISRIGAGPQGKERPTEADIGAVVEALRKMAWNIDATRNTLMLSPVTSSINTSVDNAIKKWTAEIKQIVAEM